MFDFKKFSSIETVKTRMLYGLRLLSTDIEWVGLNKVDGSNFQIATDGEGNIRFGRRSAYLSDNELNFGGLDTILKEDLCFDKSLQIIKRLKRPLIFFGEIFGVS